VLRVALALVVGVSAVSGMSMGQSPASAGPSVPFEDPGACPFEGCVYREWTATAPLNVRSERRRNAPIVFTLRPSEKITAITGVVITIRPGRVEFQRPTDVSSSSGVLRIEPGETLYLLTYQGEGFTKAWFRGRLYEDVDTVVFTNSLCESQPDRCSGKIIEPAQAEWWVQVRNRSGAVGWTNEPDKFDGKDALAGM
jgi:hypothetical protein